MIVVNTHTVITFADDSVIVGLIVNDKDAFLQPNVT